MARPNGRDDAWRVRLSHRTLDQIDSPQPTVLGAHELAEGKSYFILPTTSYGLYRYLVDHGVRCSVGAPSKLQRPAFVGW